MTITAIRDLLQANLTKATIAAAANDTAIAVTGYSLTGSDATSMIDLAGTWNTTGTPTALKLDVTDTASNAASLLMDLQADSVSMFQVFKDGDVDIPLNKRLGSTGSWFQYNNKASAWYGNSTLRAYIFVVNASFGGISIDPGFSYCWGTTAASTLESNNDLKLWRDAAGTLAQRDGTNAQEFRVYNTYTDASNYERLAFDWATTSNVARIRSTAAGTGTTRPLAIDAYAMNGAPTTSELPDGTWGVFKDNSGGSPGNVVIAYNDEGNILTASLT